MYAEAVAAMKSYYGENERSITHALQVLDFARKILEGEEVRDDFVTEVVNLAALFHDVGIPEALRKHGSAAGPLQEKEGEPIARRLLTELGARPDIKERVCYIVRYHHTRERVDGTDFQIIWEADALVNIPNGWARYKEVPKEQLVDSSFCTATGRQLIAEIIARLEQTD